MDNIMTDTPTGPMTRSRAKAIQEKVISLLSSNQFNLSMDGLLPQVDTFCILRYEPDEKDSGFEGWDEQDDEDQARGRSGDKAKTAPDWPASNPASSPAPNLAGLQPGLGPGLSDARPTPQPKRPATLQNRPASSPALTPARPASQAAPFVFFPTYPLLGQTYIKAPPLEI